MEPIEASVWPYVHCAVCHHLFQRQRDPTGQPVIPFWLTECGHVICNTHLQPDRSCAHCGSPDIQVASLSHQLEQPMADWFRPLPYALDAVAHAAKFQLEMITTLLQAYKSKCIKQKQTIDALRAQNEAYRQELEQRDVPNVNNKRMRYESVEQFTVRSSDPATVSMTTPSRAAPKPPQHQRPPTTMPNASAKHHSVDPSPPPAAAQMPSPRTLPTMVGEGTGRAFGRSKHQQQPTPQPPPRPESRFDQFAFSPPGAPGPPTRTAPTRVSHTSSGFGSSSRPAARHAPAPPSNSQAMPPPRQPNAAPTVGRFRPAAQVPATGVAGVRAPFGGGGGSNGSRPSMQQRMATPSVNRSMHGATNRQRFSGGGVG